MDHVPMTKLGYDQLKAQLDKLKLQELPRLQKAIGDAREMGDLSENSEFETAREELWRVDRRILELEDQLARAQIVDGARIAKDEVAIGATVSCEDVDSRRKDEFMVVGEGERRDGIDTVSVASPLGQALIGKRVGDTAEIQAPRGKLRYKVIAIRYE